MATKEAPKTLLLFPSQLFSKDLWPKGVERAVMIEHPLFYGKRRGSGAVGSLALNQARLAYMQVAGRRYAAAMGSAVRVVPYRDAAGFKGHAGESYCYMDACDTLLDAWVKRQFPGIERHDSPSFLLSQAQLVAAPGTSERMSHGAFYDYVKETRKDMPALAVLGEVKNQDVANREPYRAGKMPVAPNVYRRAYSDAGEWRAALEWVRANGFGKNPGPLMGWDEWIQTIGVYLPVERAHARAWFQDFLKERFANYGKYQDVVLYDNPMLFHSGVSVFLNNGLLTPAEVLAGAYKMKKQVSLAAYEGFVRQIAGWREYCRLYYMRVPAKAYKKNVFGLRGTVGAEWYKATTGVEPLDKTIRQAMNYGYINHIQRLMVVSNWMTLNGKSPDALYRWMFEFSLDSYEWVMVFNCYSMGSWGDGGVAMRKPYISSANYVLTMSDAEIRKGGWVEDWTAAYRGFMKHHQGVLRHTQAWRPGVIKNDASG